MEIAIDKLDHDSMALEPIARIVDGVITEGEEHLDGIPFMEGDFDPDAILDRFNGPTLFARPVGAGIEAPITEKALPPGDREIDRQLRRGETPDPDRLAEVASANVLLAAYEVGGDVAHVAKTELLARGYHPEIHRLDADYTAAIGAMPDTLLKEYVASGALLRLTASDAPPEVVVGGRTFSRDECLELLRDTDETSRATVKDVVAATDRTPSASTETGMLFKRAISGQSLTLPETDREIVVKSTGRNERTTMQVTVAELPVPSDTTLAKAQFDYEAVDDALFAAIRKQVWEDDISKAPLMWEDSSNVPRFVKRFVDEAIEEENALYGEFSGVHDSAVAQLHGIIENELLGPVGWSIRSVANAIYGSFGEVSKDQAENIARTEIAAVLNTARMLALSNSDHEVEFTWVGPDDHATTDLCQEVKAELDRRGGHLSLDELKDLLRRKAHKFADTYGTPGRVEQLLPHFRCRHTLQRADMAHL